MNEISIFKNVGILKKFALLFKVSKNSEHRNLLKEGVPLLEKDFDIYLII